MAERKTHMTQVKAKSDELQKAGKDNPELGKILQEVGTIVYQQAARYVLKEDCDATHNKINLALLGHDGTGLNGGIVKDISDIKAYIKDQCDKNKEKKVEHREYRSFMFAIVGGLIVAIITITIKLILHI